MRRRLRIRISDGLREATLTDRTTTPIAVVDLGTNTTRLLVCEVAGGQVTRELDRRTLITRLGEGVDRDGRLTEAAKNRVREALAGFEEPIAAHGAQRTVAVATSAIRDAEDGPAFRDEISGRFAMDVRTLTGNEEARLTFRGATAARARDDAPTLVIDIGGGSTELVVGPPGTDPTFDVSTSVGSVRQTERHLGEEDPPASEALQALSEEVRRTFTEEAPEGIRSAVVSAIAVAGTATSLAAISQQLEPYDPALVHGFALELGEAERILAMLATLPLEDRREVAGLHPERAPTIVAGAVILVEAIRAFGLDRVEVSEADILHGAALEAAGETPH